MCALDVWVSQPWSVCVCVCGWQMEARERRSRVAPHAVFDPSDCGAQHGRRHGSHTQAKRAKAAEPAGQEAREEGAGDTVPVSQFLGKLLEVLVLLQEGAQGLRQCEGLSSGGMSAEDVATCPLDLQDGVCVLDRAWQAWVRTLYATASLPAQTPEGTHAGGDETGSAKVKYVVTRATFDRMVQSMSTELGRRATTGMQHSVLC